ncbi:NAD(P)/FAD-dependent oxidoreductase [Mesobaculum littorinae]|uniref:Trimethylamine monooxygenase n=1 Tax=Mesobaculum littorinae TaxID=2486419 RepID=A0A438AEG9_9RHOB|nr:NAD(P)/FAD-dependent oxidoreductase [Mesobaculum littorinae]RVV97079.1 NAD(P)/FAD-dependent oxidoreductase [Mesobaculum littorinae]
MSDVAIIGAGPGGLAAARWLKARGFVPTLYDSHDDVGGQWNTSNPLSGVWPQMRTNTFIATTQFSDLDYADGTAVFPRNREVLEYLRAYARKFGLLEGAQFGTALTALAREGEGYRLSFDGPGGPFSRSVSKVVVATGRYNRPTIPDVPGLDGFTGRLGVAHAHRYKDPEVYRGARVVVAGGSISALEIASDLSMLGARSVHLAQRRQRYVMPKMIRGVPFEYYGFTYGAAAAPATDKERARAGMLEFALSHGGDPARYGAPAPHPDVLQAGFTGSQHYLNLVAEDRLTPVPWFDRVDGQTITFGDGRQVEADAILFGTGFDLNLPFLSQDIADTLEIDRKGLTLSEFTLHPDLPGLGFMGLWSQNGGYLSVLELQARFLAYSWAGLLDRTEGDLRHGLEACRTEMHHAGYQEQHEMALRFARLGGFDPQGQVDEAMMDKVRRSATTPLIYRLAGPDALPDAGARVEAILDRYGPDA